MSNSGMGIAGGWRRRQPQILAAILLLALLAWIAVGIWWDARRAWAILLTDFLFLSCLAAGLVVWPAIVVVSRGTWMGSTQRTALAAVVLLPVCVVTLLVLVIGGRYWAPWFGVSLPNSWWLNARFLFARDVIALVVFSLLAWWFVRAMDRGGQPKRLAAWLIFIYSIVFSILGIDLAMGLDPRWYSLVFGIYFFISGLLIAVVAWVLITATVDDKSTPDQLSDQSKLVVAFSMLTAYLMYCQLLPIWYENLPQETRYLVPRMSHVTHWPYISVVLLTLVYLGPLVLFLRRGAKRSYTYTGTIAGLILTALWLERWWLVMPSLGEPLRFGPAEVTGVTALVAGLLLFGLWLHRSVVTQGPQDSGGTSEPMQAGGMAS
jgi:hypothetical protein